MAATLAALCPPRCRGVSGDPAGDLAGWSTRLRAAPLRGHRLRPARRRRPATLTALGALGPDVRLRLQPGDPRRHPGRRAGGARQPRPGAAAAARRRAAASLSAAAGARSFSAARYATVCEETPLPWPRGAPFGERARGPRPRPTGSGRGAFFPFGYEEARADEIDLCLRWPEASAPRRCRRRLPGGAGADPPGRRGPAHAAGGLGARRGGAAGRAAGRACRGSGTRSWAGTRRAAACGGCSRSCAGGRPRRRARAWRRWCPRSACRRRRCGSWRRGRRAGRAGRTVARARRRRSTTSRSRSRRRSARRWRARGCAAGRSACAARAIVLRRPAGGPGRAGERLLPRRGSARLRISGRARGGAAGCGSRRAAWCAGGSAGGRVRGRLRAGPPRPVAGGAQDRGEDGAVPAQGGLVFRPSPGRSFFLHRSRPGGPRKLTRSTPR